MGNRASKFADQDWKIFLVDDDVDDRDFFSDALNDIEASVRLTLFSSGEDVLEKLASTTMLPDIIFLDLYMPVMGGEHCLARIRENKKYDNICVVIYSTLMDIDQIEVLFNAGANRFLKKPSSYPALKHALDRAFESLRQNPLGGHTIINYSE